MIKVIYLDLGKVIIDFDYGVATQTLMKASRLPVSELTNVFTDLDLIFRYETGRMSTLDFFQEVSERLKLELSLESFRQLWGSMFLPDPLLSDAFLEKLKRNHRLILLSNTNEIHFEFLLENYSILRHIEEYLLSYEVGRMKPDKHIFQAAIRKAGVPANEIFFTDDRAENVEAARQEGLQAVQFHSEEQLRRELTFRGIGV